MKKILLSSIVIVVFSLSIIMFQISCQKDATAQTGTSYILPPATTSTLGGVIVGSGLLVSSNGTLSSTPASLSQATTSTLGGVIVGSGLNISSNGTLSSAGLSQQNKIIYFKMNNSVREIWSANFDGSNQKKISVSLPSGSSFSDVKISPDGQSIFITVDAQGTFHIYKCNIDGSNLTKIIDGTGLGTEGVYLEAAY